MIGSTIGQYTILGKVGEGGMGVVYKARDEELDRLVALKFLPEHLSEAANRLERFAQEAKAAAALNHPNICTIYGVARADRAHFIVMEYVDGYTLEEKKTSLTFKQALDIGIQVGEGLAAAHEHGIVHRDIKPDNIMIRKDGRVKIMDFGIAKIQGTTNLTKVGSTVGTASYMSPEQVQGNDVGHRSDVFSLGVLLFEICTGRLPYKGMHDTAVSYEIVNVMPPSLSSIRGDIPQELDAIVLECLEKDPAERTQAAGQVALELRRLRKKLSGDHPVSAEVSDQERRMRLGGMSGTGSAKWPSAVHKWRNVFFAGILVALAIACGIVLGYLLFTPASQEIAIRSSIRLPDGVTYVVSGGGHSAISPDGKYLVFDGIDSLGERSLWLRSLDSVIPVRLQGTGGASYPFWSHDSRSIAFFAAGELKRVDISGGPPLTLAKAPTGRGGAWGSADLIVFVPKLDDPTIYAVPASGGASYRLFSIDSVKGKTIVPRFPSFLPDGEHFVFSCMDLEQAWKPYVDEAVWCYVGGLDGMTTPLNIGMANPQFASDHLIFFRDGALVAQSFDPDSYKLSGKPIPLATDVNYSPWRAKADYSVSRSGVLIYVSADQRYVGEMLWIEKNGTRTTIIGTNPWGRARISPDEKRIAYTDRENFDIWIYDHQEESSIRFVFGTSVDMNPVWSPDGTMLYFCSNRLENYSVYRKPTNGLTSEQLVLALPSFDLYPLDMSPDGRYLLLHGYNTLLGRDQVFVVDMEDVNKMDTLGGSGFVVGGARFSPDGKWIVCHSSVTGGSEIYVFPFRAEGSRWQISIGGGSTPQWEPSGKITYSTGGEVMSVDADIAGRTPRFSHPRVLFSRMDDDSRIGILDAASNGKRFLARRYETSGIQFSLLTHWPELLTRNP